MRRQAFGTWFGICGALAIGAGCAPSPVLQQGDGSGGGSSSTSGGDSSSSTGTGAGDDVQTMMADVVAPRICDSLRGTFIGLPGEGGHSGPDSGLDPTVGRWWIRDCTSHSHDGVLDLSIGGTGWTWVDRESMGFRVQQYLRFDATAAFTARMEIAYDHNARIVTIWMRPLTDDPAHALQAHVEPRGLVQAHATGAFSGVLGGLLSMTGSSADDRARQQVTDEGSQRLHDRFASGMTVTYAMDSQQMDFMVGALERGQVPVRPYAAEAGIAAWSVNQRLSVFPGGLDVIGPIDTSHGNQRFEMELEEGGGVYVDAVCQADFERFYDTVLQGGTAATPTGTRVFELTAPHQSQHALVPALGCPTLLLVTPHTDATLSSTARVRVCPPPPETATTTVSTGTGTTSVSTTSTSSSSTSATTTSSSAVSSRPVRVHLTGLTVATASASGSAWDMIGSEPDPYVVVASVPGQREIERTTASADTHEITLDHWLPGAYHAEDFPIRFSVYDDDVGSDELIGVADVTAAQIATGGDFALELRSQGDVPRTMGSLRLSVVPVQ
ncbi:MAG: hypothetical protein U0234_18185 [Sandaracinus sp.]